MGKALIRRGILNTESTSLSDFMILSLKLTASVHLVSRERLSGADSVVRSPSLCSDKQACIGGVSNSKDSLLSDNLINEFVGGDLLKIFSWPGGISLLEN